MSICAICRWSRLMAKMPVADDAVYCEKNGGGWRLMGRYCADVSYYVRPPTPLDREARIAARRFYFRHVPQCCRRCSPADLCSLNPQVDGNVCMVCEGHLGKRSADRHKFYEAVMSSHARVCSCQSLAYAAGRSWVCVNNMRLVAY
ncbi:RNB domain-containing ribonuclease [Salmonella enterica subsp. enterica serovar Weltevreden]|nr:RNB domain-containing ribonuclease [Salmonella enterica subsp. enterica serovar Weltevreden]